MPPRKSGLGRGLDALIPGSETAIKLGDINQIYASDIRPNPHQPRSLFDEGELAELADSIKEHGVLQPLIVTQSKDPGEYILIAGERRLQAAKLAGLDKVPVVIREASDSELLELALIENLQRADLNPLEAAEAYRQLSETFQLSHDDIAARVGKSRVAVTNTLGLLDLSAEVKEALAKELISEGHARALKTLSEKSQAAALKTVIERGLNVRQTEELARKLKGQKPRPKSRPAVEPEIQELEQRLRAALSTKVSVRHGRKGGSIVIHYYSDEELDALVEKLSGEDT